MGVTHIDTCSGLGFAYLVGEATTQKTIKGLQQKKKKIIIHTHTHPNLESQVIRVLLQVKTVFYDNVQQQVKKQHIRWIYHIAYHP